MSPVRHLVPCGEHAARLRLAAAAAFTRKILKSAPACPRES
jgi:hypothetical protein